MDYFDFYLLHSIEDGSNYEVYEKYDCFSWGLKMKDEGKIRHFGFSYHGSPELLEEVLDKHPADWLYCLQILYSGMSDEHQYSGCFQYH